MTDNPQGKKSVGQEELDDSKEVIRFRKSKNSMYLITAREVNSEIYFSKGQTIDIGENTGQGYDKG